jgi:hypothetical protein
MINSGWSSWYISKSGEHEANLKANQQWSITLGNYRSWWLRLLLPPWSTSGSAHASCTQESSPRAFTIRIQVRFLNGVLWALNKYHSWIRIYLPIASHQVHSAFKFVRFVLEFFCIVLTWGHGLTIQACVATDQVSDICSALTHPASRCFV